MLSLTEKELFKDRIYRLLWDEGMKIENEQIVSAMLKNGCKQAASGRVRIAAKLIEQMAAYQTKTQAQDDKDQKLHYRCGIDWAHHIIWNKKQDQMIRRLDKEFLMSAFDCGPTTYYHYQQNMAVPVDTDIFIKIKKFAQVTPEIGYISTWYRQDVSPKIERIDSLILGLKHTDKVDGIEAIYPEVIKYLKEISEIVTGRPGDSSYLAGSECITSPLILEKRSADDIVERAARGIARYHVASMPTIGVSTPVTLAGSVVMAGAEILGGMAACYAVDGESDLSGRCIVLVADMRNANNTASAPEPTMVNVAVRELFDAWWGGHLWVEVFFSTFAKRPGFQAMYENFNGQWRTSKLLGDPDIPYPGMGTLDNGGMGSVAQFMLDMDIRKSQFATKSKIAVDEESLHFDGVCQAVRDDSQFLSSEHTMDHFRQLWSSDLFLTESPGLGDWAGDEKAILDKCEQKWQENLKKWEPPQWPEETIKALDKVLAGAKKEFGID